MAFENTIKHVDRIGKWKIKVGTYTNGGSDTGGELDTGLGNLLGLFLMKTGNGTTTDLAVVNETFPDVSGPYATIITKAGDDGIWLAIEGQKTTATTTVDEVQIFDVTRSSNKYLACGQIVDGGNGAVAAVLTSVLEKIDWMILQPIDSSVAASSPVINETFPVDAGQSGGITIACTASKTYLFLACGEKGGA